MIDITEAIKVKAFDTMANVLQSNELSTFKRMEMMLDVMQEADEIIKTVEARKHE